MNKKRILALVLCLLCILLALPACGGSTEEEAPPAENLPTINPKEWEGLYVEEIAHRGTLTVKATGEQTASFTIDWPGSASSRAYFTMNGVYDPQKAAFVYSDATYIEREFDADGKETDNTVYTNGTGSFTPGDRRLIWTDETDPSRGATSFLYDKALDASEGGTGIVIIPSSSTPTEPSATPAPTQAPSPTPAADPAKLPIIKKSPTDETVKPGGSCSFVARYENAIWAVWHFVSPDGKTDLTYEEAAKEFPKLEIINGMYSTMKLNTIPAELNGWRVYCRYRNNNGYTDTQMALITVTSGGTPTPTPTPTAAPTTAPEPTATPGPIPIFPTPTSAPEPEPTPGLGPVVDEWVETYSLDEAVTNSGVSFTPPVEQAIPEGLRLKTFRYRDGMIEAAYCDSDGNVKMRIRKSYNTTGVELSGDYSSYSNTWDLVLKGVTLQCKGDGVTINAAYFSNWYDNYSIVYNPGLEGQGLTPDQLNSLLNSMQ